MADKYGIQFAIVPIDNETVKATPVPDDATQIIFGMPSKPNCRAEVLSIGVSFVTLPADGSNVFTYDLVFHDASADADTVLLDDANMLSGITASEILTVWTGNQSLDPGDTIRSVFTVTTPDTAGVGGAWVVAYRIKEWGGE